MKFSFITSLSKIPHLHEVDMDTGITFLSADASGFITYGVSSCIVLIGYYKDELMFMSHVSTPGSKEDRQASIDFIDNLFSGLLSDFDSPKKQERLTIYAIGGQKSSQNTVDALRAYAKRDHRFTLNVDGLHLVHHEDCFDLIILKNEQHFYLKHHLRCPLQAIETALDSSQRHPAPLLFALSFIASHQPELTLENRFENEPCSHSLPGMKKGAIQYNYEPTMASNKTITSTPVCRVKTI